MPIRQIDSEPDASRLPEGSNASYLGLLRPGSAWCRASLEHGYHSSGGPADRIRPSLPANRRGPLLERSHAVPSTRRTTARNGEGRKAAVELIGPFAFAFATVFRSRLALRRQKIACPSTPADANSNAPRGHGYSSTIIQANRSKT